MTQSERIFELSAFVLCVVIASSSFLLSHAKVSHHSVGPKPQLGQKLLHQQFLLSQWAQLAGSTVTLTKLMWQASCPCSWGNTGFKHQRCCQMGLIEPLASGAERLATMTSDSPEFADLPQDRKLGMLRNVGTF